MKIVITGAGGGHFYPLLAVIERVRKEVFIQKIVPPEVYFFSDKPYDERALFDLQIKFTQIPAGKLHLYPSLETLTGLFKTAYGIVVAFIKLYQLYPDVIFAKGGYASFPTLFAARMLSIPVIVHESDSVAGRTTSWAGKFAARVAVSYKEAAAFFPKSTVAYTGQPIRENLIPAEDFTRTYPAKERPVILVLGGSQGSQTINEALLPLLPNLLNKYDIVHQVGSLNKEDMKKVTDSLLRDHQFKEHYFMEGFIDVSLFYPKVDMVITRAGSSMFEMALWKLPLIIIPIPETISRDQRTNAYTFSSYGVGHVIEENNLSVSVFSAEIARILESKETYEEIVGKTAAFEQSRTAAATIARELIRIGLSHSA
jgi:UDP-N-acetylglucosamine--N-acetylmuramyl-(pentapeptide) pyrophosphoryl-undecaprenol N-acetylglucosamine transferase